MPIRESNIKKPKLKKKKLHRQGCEGNPGELLISQRSLCLFFVDNIARFRLTFIYSSARPETCPSFPVAERVHQVYQRMRDYYGPQYDIQTGVYHQGYGDEDNYDSFWGKGSLYIDLPRSRVYDASFNCTPGFQARRTYTRANKPRKRHVLSV